MKATTQRHTIVETDLYPPLAEFFTNLGYTVRGEVLNCDLAASRDDELVIVELKRSINLSLLIQATNRQQSADAVYVAVPRPSNVSSAHWRGAQKVLKQLRLGLIVISFSRLKPRVEVVFHPTEYKPRSTPSHKRLILKELLARSGDYNQGGSTRRKLMTAYRENAIFIACCLKQFGPQSPKQLRNLGTGDKTLSILKRDVYGWFTKETRGIYCLNQRGEQELSLYPELVTQYMSVIEETTSASEK